MSVYLKVKIKSLTEEAKIIKHEESKRLGFLKRHSVPLSVESEYRLLNGHRRGIVRNESRSTFLAYGFLRGRAFDAIETRRKLGDNSPANKPNWHKVWRMVRKYNETYTEDELRRQFLNWSGCPTEVVLES